MEISHDRYCQYFNLGYELSQKKITVPTEILTLQNVHERVAAIAAGMRTLRNERDTPLEQEIPRIERKKHSADRGRNV